MTSNIPAGYDENGVRNGTGEWHDEEDECPNCGSRNIFYNSSDELICDNCGYEEAGEEYEIL